MMTTERLEQHLRDSAAKARNEPRKPRFNQVLWAKIGFVSSVLSGAVLVGGLWFGTDQTMLTQRRMPTVSATERELTEFLHRLRSTWEPTERANLLAEGRRRSADFRGPLGRLLRSNDQTLLAPAIDCAAELGAAELHPFLAQLADADLPTIAARAIRGAHRLVPWSTERLIQFMDRDQPIRCVAAIECAATDGTSAPWAEIADLLSADEPMVRDAAQAAIPVDVSVEVANQIWGLVGLGDPATAHAALITLSRTERATSFATRVVDFLRSAPPAMQAAALQFLESTTGIDSEFAWSLVEDSSMDARVQTRAFERIEIVTEEDAQRVVNALPILSPMAKFAAARRLLGHDDPRGIELLLVLAGTGLAGAETPSEPDETATASRRLLAWLTGLAPSASLDQFQERLTRSSAPRRGRTLPQNPLITLPSNP